MYFAIYAILMFGELQLFIDEGPYYSYSDCQVAVLREIPALKKAEDIEPIRIVCHSFDLADA